MSGAVGQDILMPAMGRKRTLETKAEARPEPDHDAVEGDSHGASNSQREPETKALSQHGGDNEKHRQGWQDEPERRLRMGRHIRRVGPVPPKPDHSQHRHKWQGRNQATETGIAFRNLGNDRDEDAGQRRLDCKIPHADRLPFGQNVRNGGKRTFGDDLSTTSSTPP